MARTNIAILGSEVAAGSTTISFIKSDSDPLVFTPQNGEYYISQELYQEAVNDDNIDNTDGVFMESIQSIVFSRAPSDDDFDYYGGAFTLRDVAEASSFDLSMTTQTQDYRTFSTDVEQDNYVMKQYTGRAWTLTINSFNVFDDIFENRDLSKPIVFTATYDTGASYRGSGLVTAKTNSGQLGSIGTVELSVEGTGPILGL